ncbi:MAG: DUF2178 domain-containing protein [Patescibacteria group bacterium]
MTYQRYKFAKIIVAMILAAVISQAIIIDNYPLAAASVAIAAGLMMMFRRQVKEVIADERDYQIAGKAARYAMVIFAVMASIATFILIALREGHPLFEVIGYVLAYATCFILLVYSIIFNYLNKPRVQSRKVLAFILMGALLLAFVIVGLRLFSGDEDTWLCDEGQWIKHGNPRTPMPDAPCVDDTM